VKEEWDKVLEREKGENKERVEKRKR